MVDLLQDVSVGELSFVAVFAAALAAVVRAIIQGRLVPRSVLEDVRRDRDARLAEKEASCSDWRDAYRAADARGDILAGQIEQLMRQGQTIEHLLEALQQATRHP